MDYREQPLEVRSGWLARNFLWLIPSVVLASLALVYFLNQKSLNAGLTEAPVQCIMATILENSEITSKLGANFKRVDNRTLKGEFRVSGFEEFATIEPFKVHSLKAEATVTGKVRKNKQGTWLPSHIIVKYDDGTEYEIRP